MCVICRASKSRFFFSALACAFCNSPSKNSAAFLGQPACAVCQALAYKVASRQITSADIKKTNLRVAPGSAVAVAKRHGLLLQLHILQKLLRPAQLHPAQRIGSLKRLRKTVSTQRHRNRLLTFLKCTGRAKPRALVAVNEPGSAKEKKKNVQQPALAVSGFTLAIHPIHTRS
jgi:hypothetical protein